MFLDEMEHRAMQKNFTVYILASKRNGTLYIGVGAQEPLGGRLHEEIWGR